MDPILTFSTKLTPFPYAALCIAYYTGVKVVFDEAVMKIQLNGNSSSDEVEIVQILAKVGNLSDSSTQAATYTAFGNTLRSTINVPDVIAALDFLDDHLAYRTYMIGHQVTVADWHVWGASKGHAKIEGLLRNNKHPHLLRWYNHLYNLKTTQQALTSLTEAKSALRSGNKTAASFAMELEGAVKGQVVTRFPPEPSGYLHIGHAKAALLNQYFARRYEGKMIIRFDDTNPSKETAEFQDTILEDLNLLGVHGDVVTHTSDNFEYLYDCALQLIKSGKAYADDTAQEEMRLERGKGIASKRRDVSVELNLQRFEEMKTGSTEGQKWCIRAKMSVDNPNKAMRDPVVYRCNVTPHHRTGTTWKMYPTYDFACPVIDSKEGVTHALRTNEYRDRNPQYAWMIEALGIRSVHVWDFSRLNFIYTLLSKRKLHWFVDQKLVSGWDDARFPTVRGIRRRGMTVEALHQFMLQQGPSAATVSLEWDSIWSLNKRIIDPVAPRFWAINTNKMVPVLIHGGPTSIETKKVPKHKKNADVGEKLTIYSSTIWIEQEDAASFDDQEEITLMDWGNAIVRSKQKKSDHVTAIEMDLHLEGDFRKTKKKITWLSNDESSPMVDVELIDYDYLITKKTLDDKDDVADFVASPTEFREPGIADANIKTLVERDIIQFERKGYYIYDGLVDSKMQFILIPDGRAASVASKWEQSRANAPKPSTPAKPPPMYKVTPVYEGSLPPTSAVNMYKVKNELLQTLHS